MIVFLRHSRRISNKLQGFKDAESARKANEPAADEDEPIPLAIVPLMVAMLLLTFPRKSSEALGKVSFRFSLRLFLLPCWRRMI